MKKKAAKQTCPSCGGSGQIGLFHGESRFMISWEECYDCNGTGYAEQNDEHITPDDGPQSR